jgi:hypothetical protein
MTASRDVSELDVYDIAFLAGGLARVVDTALVALVETGRVRVHSPGELATVSLARRHPVEAAVLDAIGPSGHRSADTVRWRVSSDERVLDLGRRLRSDGLLIRVPVPRHGRALPAPTAKGRQALRSLRAHLPADAVAAGTSAMVVALGGRGRMPDQALCAAIFEQPRSALTGGVAGRPPHDLDYADGVEAARRTRARVVARNTDLGTWYGG